MTSSERQARRVRSMLFVPASRWSMIVKATTLDADAVCLDLEDSVPAAEKAAARANIVRAYAELDFGPRVRIARINPVTTTFAADDIKAIAGARLDLLMVPKVGSPADVHGVEQMLAANGQGELGLEAQIETAAGFLWAREIAQASPRLEALIFGAGDYAASMKMPVSGIGTRDEHDDHYPGHRWHAVMHTIVASARANGLRCLDGPYSAYSDAVGFEQACRIARAMGFDGKQCIHPNQLAITNRVFSPSEAEIAHARRVVEAYRVAVAGGLGAVTLDGSMVDEANIRLARVVLEQLDSDS